MANDTKRSTTATVFGIGPGSGMANEALSAVAAIAERIGYGEEAATREKLLTDLGYRALEESRVRLMMAFRFLDRALWKMPSEPGSCSSWQLATDGVTLRFDPAVLTGAFRANPNSVARAYLHTLLHCIFRHPLHTVRSEPDAWKLACDICVEAIAVELCEHRFALEDDRNIARVAAELERADVPLTPAGVYRTLLLWRKQPPSEPALRKLALDLESARKLFARDSHELWDLTLPIEPAEHDAEDEPDSPREGQGEGDASGEHGSSEPGEDDQDAKGDGHSRTAGENGADDETDNAKESGKGEGESQESTMAKTPRGYDSETGGDTPANPDFGDIAQEWAAVAEQVEAELHEISQQRGSCAGRLSDNLTLANRSRIDYADFLRRFAARGEVMKVNDEEFDYLFYTYGLNQYGNVAIVEPLEYQEDSSVCEFAIAIDTSGSCSSGLTRAFVTRTYEILSQACTNAGHMNVHVIECDAQVQSDTVIANMGDLRAYEREFEVRGFGGTDFRPVFDYVSHLAAEDTFKNLRGLVYFTDGFGAFPEQAPDYDVAFVFVERAGKRRRVPPWACKVIMDDNDLEMLEGDR